MFFAAAWRHPFRLTETVPFYYIWPVRSCGLDLYSSNSIFMVFCLLDTEYSPQRLQNNQGLIASEFDESRHTGTYE